MTATHKDCNEEVKCGLHGYENLGGKGKEQESSQ